MNNPDSMPIDIDEIVAWLTQHRQLRALSWSALERDSGIPSATLSAFLNRTYRGNVENIARRVFQYRQKVDSQDVRETEVLRGPEFIETRTSNELLLRFQFAQTGRMTMIGMGPGTGKTKTAQHYKSAVGETVYLATMEESTRSPSAMTAEVMTAMGITSRSGWLRQRSQQIVDHVRGRRALLIVDEANCLELPALEQLRAWHDKAGLGIALLGNEELAMRIRSASGSHQYARLARRLRMVHIQDLPFEEDVTAYLDAMDVVEPKIREILIREALTPGKGGLGEVEGILEAAQLNAISLDQSLSLHHITWALGTRFTDYRRRAA